MGWGSDEVVEPQSSQTARGCAGGKTHPTPPTHTLTAPLEPPSAWGQGSSLPGEHPQVTGTQTPSGKGWEGTSRRLAAPLDTLRGLMAQGRSPSSCHLTQPHSCSSTGLATGLGNQLLQLVSQALGRGDEALGSTHWTPSLALL